MDFVNLPILIFAILLCISILTSLVSLRMGVPLILIFLCVGVIAGSGSIEMLETLRRPRICLFIGTLALALILFDSGFQTEMKNYKLASRPAILLATLGVAMTAVIMAPFSHWILGINWIPAFLLTAIISSTDSAAVFFLLRSKGITLREKVKSTLEVESGANDPMAIFLTVACITLIQNKATYNATAYATLIWLFLSQLLVGGGAGYLLGKSIQYCINAVKLESALYPIFVMGMVLLGFSTTNMLGGSGFLAVYIAGLMVGNAKIQAHAQVLKFQQTMTWLSQISMFLCMGLFVSISGLKQYWQPAIILGAVLMFFARPFMVWSILSLFKRYTATEKSFISFVGLRGATSILLALMPIVFELPFADIFFNIIFVMVLLSLSVQGFLIPLAARLCHVIVPKTNPDPTATEVDLPGLINSSLILYQLTANSPVVQGEKIPRWATPILVVRKGVAYFAGSILKRLQEGDKVYVFLPSNTRRQILDHLYGQPEENIPQNNPLFGDFPIAPTTTFSELTQLYGIRVPKHIEGMTIAEFMQNEFSDLEIGDRFSLDSIELVVRAIEDGKLTDIGIDIDPTRERQVYTQTRNVQ